MSGHSQIGISTLNSNPCGTSALNSNPCGTSALNSNPCGIFSAYQHILIKIETIIQYFMNWITSLIVSMVVHLCTFSNNLLDNFTNCSIEHVNNKTKKQNNNITVGHVDDKHKDLN